jgi:hypothetical protein
MAREYATLEFARLMNSTSPQRLFRCDGCGKYFSKRRAPRKGVTIFYGSYCGKKACRLSGGAKRTEKKRERVKKAMLDLSATLWSQCDKRKSPKERSVWIADKMTREHGIEIHGKWVTQNTVDIEKRVQEREKQYG